MIIHAAKLVAPIIERIRKPILQTAAVAIPQNHDNNVSIRPSLRAPQRYRQRSGRCCAGFLHPAIIETRKQPIIDRLQRLSLT